MLWACKSLEEGSPTHIIVDPCTANILQASDLSGVFLVQTDKYAPKDTFTVKCENSEFDTTFGADAFIECMCCTRNTWFCLKLPDGREGFALVTNQTCTLDRSEGTLVQNLSFWDIKGLIQRKAHEEIIECNAESLKIPNAMRCHPVVPGQQYTTPGLSGDHMVFVTVESIVEDGKSIVASFSDGSRGIFPIAGLFAICNLWIQMIAVPIEPQSLFEHLLKD